VARCESDGLPRSNFSITNLPLFNRNTLEGQQTFASPATRDYHSRLLLSHCCFSALKSTPLWGFTRGCSRSIRVALLSPRIFDDSVLALRCPFRACQPNSYGGLFHFSSDITTSNTCSKLPGTFKPSLVHHSFQVASHHMSIFSEHQCSASSRTFNIHSPVSNFL
jgi:hypothetical protein